MPDIGQAELLPVLLLARLTWEKRLLGRRIVFFIGNESARIAFIKAYSPVLASFKIIAQCLQWDYGAGVYTWFTRVAMVANVADAPSRLSWDVLASFCAARRVEPIWP